MSRDSKMRGGAAGRQKRKVYGKESNCQTVVTNLKNRLRKLGKQ